MQCSFVVISCCWKWSIFKVFFKPLHGSARFCAFSRKIWRGKFHFYLMTFVRALVYTGAAVCDEVCSGRSFHFSSDPQAASFTFRALANINRGRERCNEIASLNIYNPWMPLLKNPYLFVGNKVLLWWLSCSLCYWIWLSLDQDLSKVSVMFCLYDLNDWLLILSGQSGYSVLFSRLFSMVPFSCSHSICNN